MNILHLRLPVSQQVLFEGVKQNLSTLPWSQVLKTISVVFVLLFFLNEIWNNYNRTSKHGGSSQEATENSIKNKETFISVGERQLTNRDYV